MPFIDLIKELKNVVFSHLRIDRDNYFEAVVAKNELLKVTACLEKFFVSPILPSQLPSASKKTLKQFGGIMQGQTLYFKNYDSDNVIAMLWPWSDGVHTTVKIIKEERFH